MTNEEIKDKAGNLLISLGLHGDDPDADEIAAEAFHEFAVELLEEAAQIAERQECSATLPPEGYADGYLNACAEIANTIHTLKESLAEPSTAR